MSNNHGLGNIDDLFRAARQDGLEDDTLDLVVSNLNGPTMMQAVGVSLDSLATNDVTLAMNIIDMSGSMTPYAGDLIRAYNDDYLATMAGSPAASDILVSTILFNERIELDHGYLNLPDAPSLGPDRYHPSGSTALYDAVAASLTNMVLYAQQLRQSGMMVRCICIVYSDGEDNASRQPPEAVRRAVKALLHQEIYTLAYVGFCRDSSNQATVQRMADAIGFPEALAAGLSHDDLRRIFHLASMSTVGFSQYSTQSSGMFS